MGDKVCTPFIPSSQRQTQFYNGPLYLLILPGRDWNEWLGSDYTPCVLELGEKRIAKEYPNGIPVTWKFSPFPEGDRRGNARLDGEHFLQYYGVGQSLVLEETSMCTLKKENTKMLS
jgi:hypothetical protein